MTDLLKMSVHIIPLTNDKMFSFQQKKICSVEISQQNIDVLESISCLIHGTNPKSRQIGIVKLDFRFTHSFELFFRLFSLPLSLLTSRVGFADHIDFSSTANNLAIFAHFLYARTYFHFFLLTEVDFFT